MSARVVGAGVIVVTLLVALSAGQIRNQTRPLGSFDFPGYSSRSSDLQRFPLFSPGAFGFRSVPHSGFLFANFRSFRTKAFTLGRRSGLQSPFFHPRSSFFGGLGYFQSGIGSSFMGAIPESLTTSRFVEEWKDRQPFLSPSKSFQGSSLLSMGMTEEEIVRALGSPLQRISTDTAEIWKYSGFSLLIKDGKLSGLR